MEVPSHCVHSVIEIRHRLSDELGKLDGELRTGRESAGDAGGLPEVP